MATVQQGRIMRMSTECSICIGCMQAGRLHAKTICNHIFHIAYLERWLRQNNFCPMCRTQLAQLEPAEGVAWDVWNNDEPGQPGPGISAGAEEEKDDSDWL